MGFVWLSLETGIISLNIIYQLIFVMVKCGVLFEIQTQYYLLFRWASASKGILSQQISLPSWHSSWLIKILILWSDYKVLIGCSFIFSAHVRVTGMMGWGQSPLEFG
jgi:hypothetical protein